MIQGEVSIRSLGTATGVPHHRDPFSLHLRIEGDRFLIDPCEGVQRRLFEEDVGIGIDYIIVTSVKMESYLGIPGLINTLDFLGRERPLTIYTPSHGYHNIQRATNWFESLSYDLVVEEIPLENPIIESDDYVLSPIPNEGNSLSTGLLFKESAVRGRFNREKAESLGVPPGPLFGELEQGNSVELDNGDVVHPSQVQGSARDEIRIVLSGRTSYSDSITKQAQGATVLIHDAAYTDYHKDKARKASRASFDDVRKVVKESGCGDVFLSYFSPDIQDMTDKALMNSFDSITGVETNVFSIRDTITITNTKDEITVSYEDHQ